MSCWYPLWIIDFLMLQIYLGKVCWNLLIRLKRLFHFMKSWSKMLIYLSISNGSTLKYQHLNFNVHFVQQSAYENIHTAKRRKSNQRPFFNLIQNISSHLTISHEFYISFSYEYFDQNLSLFPFETYIFSFGR